MEKLTKGSPEELNRLLGNMDIYLLDQVLKGRFREGAAILDAGCGEGRNLVWFIRQGFNVFAVDKQEPPLQMLRYQMRSLGRPELCDQVYQMGLDDMLFPPAAFDWVICSAVLHFAENEGKFWEMMNEFFRVTKSGGRLFIRAATDIGLPLSGLVNNGGGWYSLTDGSERFLLTEALIAQILQKGWSLLEPIKTTLVHGQRSMLTLVLEKCS